MCFQTRILNINLKSKTVLKIKNKINLIGNVLDIGLNGEEYLFIDHCYVIYSFSLKKFAFSFSKRVSKNPVRQHQYSKAPICSKDGYVITPSVSKSVASVYKVEGNEIFLNTKLRWHRATISASKFSDNNKYFATGGEDGRIFIYSHLNAKLHTILPRRSDYISCIAFGKHSELISYASYDLTLSVYDFKTDKNIRIIKTPSVVEDMVFFSEDEKIFYVCKNGETGIFDLKNAKNYPKEYLECWPTKIALNPNESYVYVGTRKNILYIYPLYDEVAPLKIDLSDGGITCIKQYDNLIFICFANGSIQIVDSLYRVDKFLELLNQKNFEESKVFAEKNNILLKTLDIYREVKNIQWEQTLKNINSLLLDEDYNQALQKVVPYFEDSKKEEQAKNYMLKRTYLKEFLSAFEQKNYSQAYKLASENPVIKNLVEYKKMEEYFEISYNESLEIIVQDPIWGKKNIKESLKIFEEVPEKKQIITTLLKYYDEFLLAEKYAKEQNYPEYFLLAKRYPFIRGTRTYQKIYLTCEQVVRQIQDLIASKDYTQALSKIGFLSRIDIFRDFVDRSRRYLENVEVFLIACKMKNYTKCYEMLKLCPEMHSLKEYIKLTKYILEIFDGAKVIAQKGNTKGTYAKLKVFFGIEPWMNKINMTMKIAYLYEMQNMLQEQVVDIDWDATINAYVQRYGRDDEIKSFCATREDFREIFKDMIILHTKIKEKNIDHLESIIFMKNQIDTHIER